MSPLIFSQFERNIQILSEDILNRKKIGQRLIVAIAGPPASGKSMLSESLLKCLNEIPSCLNTVALLPMDGFHLDNSILESLDLLDRKGSLSTFDIDGFFSLVARLKDTKKDIFHPIFDRSLDLTIAGAGVIKNNASIVIIEGNYLLIDSDPWSIFQETIDYSVFINPPIGVLEKRLIERWKSYGFNFKDAENKANNNDLLNAHFILENSKCADVIIT